MPIRITQNKIIFNDNSELTTAPVVQASFPVGTKTIFQQTTAPTGWTKITDYHDYALRLVNTNTTINNANSFTTVFSNRTPTGNVSISVDPHSSTSTNPATSSVTINPRSINATISGSTQNQTISFSGSTGSSTSSQQNTGGAQVTVSGSTQGANAGVLSHSHNYNVITSVSTTPVNFNYTPGSTESSYVTGINVTLGSGTTGTAGDFNPHSHEITVTGGYHEHTFTVPAHSHGINASNTGSHSHGISFNTTINAHDHTVTDNGHSHPMPTLYHSASASFSGSSMNFSINYVDVILAQKN